MSMPASLQYIPCNHVIFAVSPYNFITSTMSTVLNYNTSIMVKLLGNQIASVFELTSFLRYFCFGNQLWKTKTIAKIVWITKNIFYQRTSELLVFTPARLLPRYLKVTYCVIVSFRFAIQYFIILIGGKFCLLKNN